jgi:indole-3-glycerol phosphate synthase
MILDMIAGFTRSRLEQLKMLVPLDEIKEKARTAAAGAPFRFENALKGGDISFICEVKKASPSKGLITEDFPYLQIAKEYEAAGASAVSVLTEPEYFQGSNSYLYAIRQGIEIPVLRKDFTVDEYQIYEAKTLGADAILLICALLDTETLKRYIDICDSLGLSALVEAHTEEEVRSALQAGARMVGVNNRNLQTFEVDLNTGIRLRRFVPDDKIFISESGIKTAQDIELLRQANVNAVLIGETLMRSKDKKAELNRLRSCEA